MSSTISNFTSILDVTFPIPGVDNDTQGFRDNYAIIAGGLSALGNEVTDLQASTSTLLSLINTLTNSISNPNSITVNTTVTTVDLETVSITANSINVRTVSSTATITANKFAGDGSLLTNITLSSSTFNTLRANSITLLGQQNVLLTSTNNTLLILGTTSLTLEGFSTTSTGVTGFLDNLYDAPHTIMFVTTTSNIVPGSTFYFPGGSTKHTVLGVESNVSIWPTLPANTGGALFVDAPSTEYPQAPTTITFKTGKLMNVVDYAKSAPQSSKGAPGDKKGLIFCDGSYVYVCYQTYTNGVLDIWSRVATSGTTW